MVLLSAHAKKFSVSCVRNSSSSIVLGQRPENSEKRNISLYKQINRHYVEKYGSIMKEDEKVTQTTTILGTSKMLSPDEAHCYKN